jgi:acyl phosphate:glycerol-3-phosphate acyltransferase
MRTIWWVLIGYWAGTLPSPYIVARLAGRGDVIAEMRRQESPGDAHYLVAKKMSGALGVVAIILDILKGFIPALAARMTDQPHSTLAAFGVAAVAGHCYPPYFRRSGGRGLTTAAGVSLVIIPKAMIGTGVIAMVGTVAKRGGFGTSVGFALLPVFAALFGYDAPIVAMAAGIVAVIALRRLEGLSDDRAAGVTLGKALLGRLLFDLPRGGRDHLGGATPGDGR